MPPPHPEPSETSASSDADLILALRQGRLTALGTLYDRYANLVYGLALKLLMNAEEAEDLTQEIFLSLHEKTLYDSARGSLLSFLMVMTRSRALDRLRSRGTKVRFLQRWQGLLKSERSTTAPIEQVLKTEQVEVVKRAMAQLPESERQVLEIAYYEGCSQSEIAERLDLPLGTVKTRSRRALMKLRQALQNVIE